MLDAEEGKKSKEEFLSAYCCYFEVCLQCLQNFKKNYIDEVLLKFY